LKLPFVGRTEYETVVQLLDAERQRSDRFQAQYHSVVERMVEMKKDGFVSKPKLEPLKPAESLIPPEVEFSIEQKAGGDPFFRRYLVNYTQAELAKGTDPGIIMDRITNGDDDDDD
jgi:hypothetical protein